MSEVKEMRSITEVMANNPLECVNILYSILMSMPDEFVVPTICTTLDQWFADHDFTEEQALDAYRGMAEAAEGCYKIFGMSPKSNNKEKEQKGVI